MTGRFGKLRPETAAIVESWDGRAVTRFKAFIHLVPLFKDGRQLKGKDRDALEAWITENATKVDPDEVQTVSFSIMELASDLFGGTRCSARNAVTGLVSGGVFSQVSKGAKGRSPLFIVMPLPPEKPP